jgi:hypothetical protein
MHDWASAGGIKIERAKEHVRQLEAALRTFRESNPYAVVIEKDEKAGKHRFVFRARHEPPAIWSTVIGEIAYHCHSALDHLWRAAWYPGGGGGYGVRGFPIVESANALKAAFHGVKHGRKKAIVDLVKEIKPYKGGNDHLYQLKVIHDTDEHRLLIPAWASFSRSRWNISPMLTFVVSKQLAADDPMLAAMQEMDKRGVDIPYWEVRKTPLCPLHDGAVLDEAPIDNLAVHMKMKPEFSIDVAFGEVEIVKGKPILETLSAITNEVESVAQAFILAGFVSP